MQERGIGTSDGRLPRSRDSGYCDTGSARPCPNRLGLGVKNRVQPFPGPFMETSQFVSGDERIVEALIGGRDRGEWKHGQRGPLGSRRGLPGVVERVANEHHAPTDPSTGQGLGLDQRILAGHQERHELERFRKGIQVRFTDGTERRGDPPFQRILAPAWL